MAKKYSALCKCAKKASQSSQPAGCELFESFSPAACTWGKILLSSPVCPSGARSELQSLFGRKNEVFSPVILIIFAAACTWQKYPDLAALGSDTSDRGQLVVGVLKGEPAPPLSFSSGSSASLRVRCSAADKGFPLLDVGVLPHRFIA